MANNSKPGVLLWYRVFCGFSAFFYLGLAVTGITGLLFDPTFTEGVDHPEAFKFFMFFFMGLLLMLGGLFLASFFLKRTPQAYLYHLVMICLGIVNGITFVPCIFLLIFWVKPETKAYFGR